MKNMWNQPWVVILAVALSSLSAFAAVEPDDVVVVEKAPKNCRSIGKVDVDAERLVPVLSNKETGRRAVRKAQRAIGDAKRRTAELGGDTVLLPKGSPDADMIAGKASGFACNRMTATATAYSSGNSESNRQGKRFHAAAEIVGVASPLNAGSGVIGGYYLSGNRLIEVSLAYTEAQRTDETNSFDGDPYSFSAYDMREDGTSTVAAVRYKHFVSNSFYWHGGIASRRTRASLYAVETFGDDATRVATVDSHDIGPAVAIGNQWQWDAFTLGCDWLGVYAPVVALKSEFEEESEEEINSAEVRGARSDFKESQTGVSLQGLRFYLGAAF